MWAVYQFYDAANEFLYVGFTGRLRARFRGHRTTAKLWRHEIARIEITWYDTRACALAAEGALIEWFKPRYNISAGGSGGQLLQGGKGRRWQRINYLLSLPNGEKNLQLALGTHKKKRSTYFKWRRQRR